MAFLTPRQRQEMLKKERLEKMAEDQRRGTLRVRQMTKAERAARRVHFKSKARS